MSWSKSFSGVGAGAKKEAQRAIRGEKLVNGGQEQSPHNATLDAVVGVVALLASQFPDSVIEGETSGHLDGSGGQVTFSVRIREARESDLDPKQEEVDSATATAPVAEAKKEVVKNESPKASQPKPAVASNTANVPSSGANQRTVPAGQDGSSPVGVGRVPDQSAGKPAGGTPPRNA